MLVIPIYVASLSLAEQKPRIEEAALKLKGVQKENSTTNQELNFNVKVIYLTARTAE